MKPVSPMPIGQILSDIQVTDIPDSDLLVNVVISRDELTNLVAIKNANPGLTPTQEQVDRADSEVNAVGFVKAWDYDL